MSAWTDFRDGIIDSLKFDEVTEELKQELTNWLEDTCLPLAKTAADSFIGQIKEQAKAEQGWYKIRDMLVLPLVINGLIYVVELVLNKTMEKTTA